jgi:hypothetical protein
MSQMVSVFRFSVKILCHLLIFPMHATFLTNLVLRDLIARVISKEKSVLLQLSLCNYLLAADGQRLTSWFRCYQLPVVKNPQPMSTPSIKRPSLVIIQINTIYMKILIQTLRENLSRMWRITWIWFMHDMAYMQTITISLGMVKI